MRFTAQRRSLIQCVVGFVTLTTAAACTPSAPAPGGAAGEDAGLTAQADAEPNLPEFFFINLLPWGEVDFSRGEFPTLSACNSLVRSLPNYSFYTTSERCETIGDPVYCTAWQSTDDLPRLDCFKGVGGCEVELKRHDLLAESGARTIAERCEPYSLADAWAQFQALTPDAQESTVTTPSP